MGVIRGVRGEGGGGVMLRVGGFACCLFHVGRQCNDLEIPMQIVSFRLTSSCCCEGTALLCSPWFETKCVGLAGRSVNKGHDVMTSWGRSSSEGLSTHPSSD